MIHPATLDSAFQTVFLAYSYPHDGKLWSIHVPTMIRYVRLSPLLCSFSDHYEAALPVTAALEEGSGIGGDVNIYSEDGRYGVLQVEGIRCMPFSAATAADDRRLFANLVWETGEPDGNAVAWDGRATNEEYELARILERISYFYLRFLDSEIPKDHPARFDGPYVGIFNFATDILLRTASEQHLYAEKAWENDTFHDIQRVGGK
jgi:hybrid polyketide synthase/nonribosomal peptide synthetase ACE1